MDAPFIQEPKAKISLHINNLTTNNSADSHDHARIFSVMYFYRQSVESENDFPTTGRWLVENNYLCVCVYSTVGTQTKSGQCQYERN